VDNWLPVDRTGSGLHWAGLCAVSTLLCVSTAFPLDFPTDTTGWALKQQDFRSCAGIVTMPMRLNTRNVSDSHLIDPAMTPESFPISPRVYCISSPVLTPADCSQLKRRPSSLSRCSAGSLKRFTPPKDALVFFLNRITQLLRHLYAASSTSQCADMALCAANFFTQLCLGHPGFIQDCVDNLLVVHRIALCMAFTI